MNNCNIGFQYVMIMPTLHILGLANQLYIGGDLAGAVARYQEIVEVMLPVYFSGTYRQEIALDCTKAPESLFCSCQHL